MRAKWVRVVSTISMSRKRLRRLLVATSVLLAWFAAEPACDAALARAAGQQTRFTARLSSNRAIRKQQLIADPADIVGGSASVMYDPRIVSLSAVLDPADFQVVSGFVSVHPVNSSVNTLQPLDAYLASHQPGLAPADVEAGFVQIFFNRKGTPLAPGTSVIPNLPGYATVAEDGATGINDTHALIFDYLPAAGAGEPRAVYTLFATPPIRGTTADSLVFGDDPDHPVPFSEIGSARVAGDLGPGLPHSIPLPPALWTGLMGLATAGAAIAFGRRG
jgi:hypothetical protein